MKTTILSLSILSLLSITSLFAQDRTTVTANNSEISDNLDLRAVASIFGESADLNDFERRLNDPNAQISNLDLNGDNQVDYLRVIETIENNTHLIVIQAVLGRDTYQDIATVEVERDANNRVQVQVVGDVYMYGDNYIYEPVYVAQPVIYTTFWVGSYRPYYSSWYWGYYPSYYTFWQPCPVFRYRSHIGLVINVHNHYNYVNYRRAQVAYNSYRGRRANAYEMEHPNRSFGVRHSGITNRYELDKTRNIKTVGTRNEMGANSPRNNNNAVSPRANGNVKNTSPRTLNQNENSTRNNTPRSNETTVTSPRAVSTPRSETPRTIEPRNNTIQQSAPRANATVAPRAAEPRNTAPQMNTPRVNAAPRNEVQRSAAPREMSSPRSNGNNAGNAPARGNSGANRRG